MCFDYMNETHRPPSCLPRRLGHTDRVELLSPALISSPGKGQVLEITSAFYLRRPANVSKVEVHLSWLEQASRSLRTYLAHFPSCHTVLHFHSFNHTDFLTFCYLENRLKIGVIRTF